MKEFIVLSKGFNRFEVSSNLFRAVESMDQPAVEKLLRVHIKENKEIEDILIYLAGRFSVYIEVDDGKAKWMRVSEREEGEIINRSKRPDGIMTFESVENAVSNFDRITETLIGSTYR